MWEKEFNMLAGDMLEEVKLDSNHKNGVINEQSFISEQENYPWNASFNQPFEDKFRCRRVRSHLIRTLFYYLLNFTLYRLIKKDMSWGLFYGLECCVLDVIIDLLGVCSYKREGSLCLIEANHQKKYYSINWI